MKGDNIYIKEEINIIFSTKNLKRIEVLKIDLKNEDINKGSTVEGVYKNVFS